MSMWKPGMKAVCVEPIGSLRMNATYAVSGTNTSCGCHPGTLRLEEFPGSFPPCSVCGGSCEVAYRPSRFRPLLSHEQEALSEIEQEVSQPEPVPA